jgi:hypothetical protein
VLFLIIKLDSVHYLGVEKGCLNLGDSGGNARTPSTFFPTEDEANCFVYEKVWRCVGWMSFEGG